MSENCTHDCSSCASHCGERKGKNPFLLELNSESRIKHVIGVVSGKGGVGKSLVTTLLASALNKKGFKTAILDGDITGPSIPKALGIKEKADAEGDLINPVIAESGIKVMSLNLINNNETDPVVWRGPILASTVKQFYKDVRWGEVDYLLVDMPPGTGDVPLTVFQSLPLNGIVVVTSPQGLVSMIVEKAVNMADMMQIPILGLVENYSFLTCPDCGKRISVFGESGNKEFAEKKNIPVFCEIPMEPKLASAADKGEICNEEAPWIGNLVNKIETLE